MPARRVGGGEGTPAGHQGLTAAPSEGHPDRPGRRQRLAHKRRPGWRSPARSLTGQLLAAFDRATGPPPDAAALTADECAGAAGPCGRSGRRPWSSARGENVLAYAKRLAARNIFRYCRRPFESVDEMGRHAAPRVGDDHRSSGHDSSAGRRRLGASPRPGTARTARRPARPEGARPRQPRLRPNRDADGNRERRDLHDAGGPRRAHPPRDARPALACAGRSRQVHGHVHNHERLRAGTLSTPTSSRPAIARCPLRRLGGNWPPAGSRSHDAGSSGCRARGRLPRRSSPAVTGGRAWRSDCAGRRPASTCSSSRAATCRLDRAGRDRTPGRGHLDADSRRSRTSWPTTGADAGSMVSGSPRASGDSAAWSPEDPLHLAARALDDREADV